MLLTIEALQHRLRALYDTFPKEVGEDLSEYLLVEGGLNLSQLRRLEHELELNLSPKFRDFLERYDLSDLTVGPFQFGAGDNYADQLVSLNSGDLQWWDNKGRPKDLLVFAIGDPYAALVDLKDDGIWGLDGEVEVNERRKIANDISLFVRAVGTVFILKQEDAVNEETAASIAAEAGGDPDLWAELVRQ